MDLQELIATKQWKQITREISPENLAHELTMLEGLQLASTIGMADFFDCAMTDYSLKLLEAIRAIHRKQWDSSWRYDAFLGRCYRFAMEHEKAFEAYKSAMKKAPEYPHPSLLIALAGCIDLPGGVSIKYSTAVGYLKMAIKDYLYIDAVMLLRSIYRIQKDTVNEEFWSEMLARALKTGIFAPPIEEAVFETDEDDARTGWKYGANIDMKGAKELEEKLRDVLPKLPDD